MPNYEIIHDQVGPFPRRILIEKDGTTSVKMGADGNIPINRVVSEDAIHKTGEATDHFEGSLKFWLRTGAIKATTAPVTAEPQLEDTLNRRDMPGSPAHTAATVASASRPGISTVPVGATQARRGPGGLPV